MKKIKDHIRHRLFSIGAVILKNFRTIFRSRSSAFIIILGPLLVMILVGMAFNNSSLFDIRIGSYSEGYSVLSDQMVQQLDDKGYAVIKTNSTLECLTGVKSGEYNLCLVFPANMTIGNNFTNEINFYVDPSRINIVDSITADINKEVTKRSENISLELTNTIVDRLFATQDEVSKNFDFFGSIKDNQENLKTKIHDSRNSIVTIDLSVYYNLFKVDEITTQFADISTKYNISESDISRMNNKIRFTEIEIKSTVNKVEDAKNKVSGISGNLDSMPFLVTNSTKQIDIVRNNLNNTILAIENIVVTNPESIVRPISTKVQPIAAKKTHIGRFLPTFIVLVILFVSILLSSSLILEERTSSAYFRNAISITPQYVFLVGAYLTSFIIMLVQLLIISLGMGFTVGFGLNLFSPIIVPVLLTVSAFILLGIIIGYVTNSQETANVISLFVIIGSLFFSNTILPLEAVPIYLKQLVLYNPFVIAEFALKKMIVFGFVLDKIKDHIVTLVWYNVIFLIVAYLSLKYSSGKAKN